LIALLYLFGFSANTLAENHCFRGTLDKQYYDRNHDLVADLPLNPS
jgi:hypothetical protein